MTSPRSFSKPRPTRFSQRRSGIQSWSYPDIAYSKLLGVPLFSGFMYAVHVAKWSSWSLLVIMTFTIVANLKHIKKLIHVPE
jgi:uncharacterized membrane protein YoaT (DUF817 family)